MSVVTTAPITAPVAAAASMPARGDSLATGVAFMLVLNIVQRAIGFARGLLFCRFLGDAALGQFSLANSFLTLAAPLMVLGLPGSFGRYVEYYRQRGQLQAYLRKMTMVTLSLTGLGIMLMSWCSESLTYWLFDDPAQLRLLKYSLAAVGIFAVFNYFNELLTAIRQVRALAWMQFVNSLAFTVIGVALVVCWESTAEAIVLAYALSLLVGLAAVLPWYGEIKAEFTHDHQPLVASDAWGKLLPFAAWVWLTNLISNLADFVDRFMILHVSGLDVHSAQALVGQYHSSRVVPLLIATLGVTVAGIVLPHWSHAWETGQRVKVSAHTNLGVKLMSIFFTAGSLLVLAGSPLLFDWILQGKYNSGLAALPWALTGAIWFCMLIIAQNYLLCAERAKLVTAACLLGVLINVGMNFIVMPWGLTAIMAARSLSTLATGLFIFGCSASWGLRWSKGLTIALLVPLVVLLNASLGAVLLIGLLVIDTRTRWLFSVEEERQLVALAMGGLQKVRAKLGFGIGQ
jgi:PST family polysaccharide transporter